MKLNRILGITLVLIGIIGFFTVADDLRHVGEFIGVASITFSGVVLLVGDFEHRLVKVLPVRWMALGTLLGIVLGAGLDNMFLGVPIGFTVGSIVGFALSRKHRFAQRTHR
jgi:hypothetical protein